MGVRFVVRAVSLASVAVAACASEGPPRGSVMVVVDTNVTPGRDFDTLRIRVQDDPSTAIAYRYGWDEATQRATVLDGGQLPLTVNVQNARDGLEERRVSVTAWKGGVPVFARDARFVLPVRGTKALRMPVEALCLAPASGAPWSIQLDGEGARSCAAAETCVAGSCRDAHVDGTTLENDAPEGVFGGAKGPGEGDACVDVLGCLGHRPREDGSLDEPALAHEPRVSRPPFAYRGRNRG